MFALFGQIGGTRRRHGRGARRTSRSRPRIRRSCDATHAPSARVRRIEGNEQRAENDQPASAELSQAEFLAENDRTTNSPLADFDFKNYTYPLPRGWQDPDAEEAVLENGRRRRQEERIGLSYVTTIFVDATGDGVDEAFVVLKIETAGAAIPQIVYLYTLKDGKPALIWHFRTGDRADGGLKNIRAENGEVIVELFGQDRFVLGDVETAKITGDEEQLCCPIYFSQTRYKYNGKDFLLQGKRLTFSMEDKTAVPVENMGEIVNAKEKSKK